MTSSSLLVASNNIITSFESNKARNFESERYNRVKVINKVNNDPVVQFSVFSIFFYFFNFVLQVYNSKPQGQEVKLGLDFG